MTDYYVNGSATGGNDGTTYADGWETFAAISWGTIGAGGHTLYVCGEYTSIWQILSKGDVDGLTIEFDPSAAPDAAARADPGSINASNACIQLRLTDNLTIQNAPLSVTGVPSTNNIISADACNNFSMLNCDIDATNAGYGFNINVNNATSNISGGTYTNCTFNNAATFHGASINATTYDISDLTFTDCTFDDNGSLGLKSESGGAGTGNIYNIAITGGSASRNGSTGIQFTSAGDIDTTYTDAEASYGIVIDGVTANTNGAVGAVFRGCIDREVGGTDGEFPCIMRNCTLDGNSTDGPSGSFENIGSEGLIIEDNLITNGHTNNSDIDGVGLWIDLVFQTAAPKVPKVSTRCIYRRNIVSNHTDGVKDFAAWDAVNGSTGGGQPGPSGIRIQSGTYNKIYDNIIINNRTGIMLAHHSYEGGASGLYPQYNEIYNNIVVNNAVAGLWIRLTEDDTNIIENNIFYDNGEYGVVETAGWADENYAAGLAYGNKTLSNNLFSGWTTAKTATTTTVHTDEVNTDPLMDGDYKPTVNSPSIQAGKVVDSFIKDYNNRPFKIPPTIGVYEVTSGFPAQTRGTATTRGASSTRSAASVRTTRT